MRILIDMQGAQSSSRTRGIGRYSLAFAQALSRNRGNHEVLLAVNDLLPELILPIRESFAALLPRDAIRVFEAPGPLAARDAGNLARRRRAEVLYEAFLASLAPDIVHVSSLFEGYGDDAVASIGALTPRRPTSVLLHDLIPLHDPERRLDPDPAMAAHYRRQLGFLGRADLLLANSAFTAEDAAARLGPDAPPIVNVSSAADDRFRPHPADRETAAALAALGVAGPYIMTSGTIEPHKNLGRLFAAVAALPPEILGPRRVVLTGRFVGEQQRIVERMARRAGLGEGVLVLAGYVGDADLVRLYGGCDLMVFPSLDEGFGLPVLEAMACGAPTIGSRAASVPEIIGRDDALFDPESVDDMARLIARALADEPFRASLRESAAARAPSFSWDRTAATALAAMENLVAERRQAAPPASGMRPARPRLAVVASDGGDEAALRALAALYDVVRIAPQRRSAAPRDRALPVRDAAWLRDNARADDHILYRLRGTPADAWMLPLIRDVPGVVALDDIFLGPVLADDAAAWTRALYAGHGYPAVRDFLADPVAASRSYPGIHEVLEAATGVVAGSETLRAAAAYRLGADVAAGWRAVPWPAPAAREEDAAWAKALAAAMEEIRAAAAPTLRDVADAAAAVDPPMDAAETAALASALARTLPSRPPQRRLLLDVTHTVDTDFRTGIQRVARALIVAFIANPPAGFRVEPVQLADTGGAWHYRLARRFTLGLLGCPADALDDDVLDPAPDDVLLALDLSGQHMIRAAAAGLFDDLARRGIPRYATVHDLLPVSLPHLFPVGTREGHEDWLRVVAAMDGAVCVSRSVAGDLEAWLRSNAPERARAFRIGWFHLGADIENSAPTSGIPADAAPVLAAMAARPTFLMVSTVEPRKGYLQALQAFDLLWAGGIDANLVIVGAEGWTPLPRHLRNTIPETVERLRASPEQGRRLFWLAGISDEYLEAVYARATCLVAASQGEGFGLPLIEAARHGLPILARDIPVFREVAGDHAAWFSGAAPADLAAAVAGWLALHRDGRHPRSHAMPWATWQESAGRITRFLEDGGA